MARIRTIKPEFWTDSIIVQLPYVARLLYVGMWNFADDEGALWDEPDRIKLQILPADDVDIEGLIDLLVATGRLSRCTSGDGREYLQIEKFLEHQKVQHASPSRITPGGKKKKAIALAERRRLAIRYGCDPGESISVPCSYCGIPGEIYWHKLNSGKPSGWVTFPGLEIDHIQPESNGGSNEAENIQLSCRSCNRKKGANTSAFPISHEDSGELMSPHSRREGKGIDITPGRRGIETPQATIIKTSTRDDRNAAWTALLEVTGTNREELTTQASKTLGYALSQILQVGGRDDDIRLRAAEFKRRYPEMLLTAPALAKHWPTLNGHHTNGEMPRCMEGSIDHGRMLLQTRQPNDPEAIAIRAYLRSIGEEP